VSQPGTPGTGARGVPRRGELAAAAAGLLEEHIGETPPAVEREGHHLSVALIRDEGGTLCAILFDLLSITEGNI
jgi:hypothetical protein